jgi:hypothetical protein
MKNKTATSNTRIFDFYSLKEVKKSKEVIAGKFCQPNRNPENMARLEDTYVNSSDVDTSHKSWFKAPPTDSPVIASHYSKILTGVL